MFHTFNVLDIPSLTIGRGITTIFGPSGSGKTTILKLAQPYDITKLPASCFSMVLN